MQKANKTFLLNFVSDDSVLNEKIRYHGLKRADTEIICSREPHERQITDLYVMEFQKTEIFLNNEYRKWFPKVIAFGNHFFLKKAFLLGCCDYLKTPWEIDEFQIRSGRILEKLKKGLVFHGMVLEGNSIRMAEKQISLTFQEEAILKMLLKNREEIVPRKVLFYSIWNNPGARESRVIDVHISAIRKKIEKLTGLSEPFIISVRGKGYRIKGE